MGTVIVGTVVVAVVALIIRSMVKRQKGRKITAVWCELQAL